MEDAVVSKTQGEEEARPANLESKYYSVEFSVGGPNIPHQFKIWRIPPMDMCLLIRKDSHILRGLKEGDTLNMKYYSSKPAYPPDALETTIRQITKNSQERFKDHFLVGLEILERRN
ncbi:MAG: hypothetical protein R6V46_02390 [Desulfatiglandaceae bacterium]|jgi:hypothetical protein